MELGNMHSGSYMTAQQMCFSSTDVTLALLFGSILIIVALAPMFQGYLKRSR